MKKRFLSIALAGALAATALVGCGKSESSKTETKAPSENESKAPSSDAKGSVYYLNFKPEQDAAYKAIAKKYEQETGVKVTVVTAASGNYESTLAAEMDKENAPTLFQVNGPVGLANWKDSCYNLKDTKVYGELTNDSYALIEDGNVYGIGYVIESYGLITNTKLLGEAGYKVDDIKSFDDLKKVAEDITARSEELGFSAFTSAGMDGSSDWRFKTHLANLPIYFEYAEDKISSSPAIKGSYLDNYRNIWDLYINNATCEGKDLSSKTGTDAENEFIEGKAVFYQNGSWEYSFISTGVRKNDNGDVIYEHEPIADEDLQMIPIYIGAGNEANQGLCTGTENYWCVNKNAKAEDIEATLEFMYWLVNSEEGTKFMAEDCGFVIPFKNAAQSNNLFVKNDTEYTNNGKTPVSWNFTTMPSEAWKNGVGAALTAYAADPSDDTWAGVKAAFVDGWKTEYDLANAK